MIEHQKWSPIPGAAQSNIFPYLRKPNFTAANTYLIEAPGLILVIDPGACREQHAHLQGVIAGLQAERPRAVMSLLTHCHVDHSLLAQEYGWVAVQEHGAGTLAAGDPRFSQAELVGCSLPPHKPELTLLTETDRATCSFRTARLPGGATIAIATEAISIGGEEPLLRQCLCCENTPPVDCFALPGHSPDCIGIRIGKLFFIGDLLIAANPLVAGIAGWDPAALMFSAQKVEWLLEQGGITHCCPGHGPILEVDSTRAHAAKLIASTAAMNGVVKIDRRFMDDMLECALAYCEEINAIFSIIAGRLYYISYYLEQCGEDMLASDYRRSVDFEEIDGRLSAFNDEVEAFRRGKRLSVEVILMAIHAMQRIQKAYHPGKSTSVIQPTLLGRAGRLLLDLSTLARGLPISDPIAVIPLNEMVQEIVFRAQTPREPANLLDAVEDEGRFLEALVSNIAHLPIFSDTKIIFLPGRIEHPVSLAPQRFGDIFTGLLEDLAGVKAPVVKIATLPACGGAELTISLPEGCAAPLSPRTVSLYQRQFATCGVSYNHLADEGVIGQCRFQSS